MFDEPNSRAFHVLALFLFAKLDLYCPEETFGDCSFPAAKWTYPEFRKWCYVWLKDIADKHQSCLPQMTPSTLMSPGGPKFVHLFYWFARHVVVEDMKTNSLGTDTPFSEALKLRPKDVHMAKARCRVAYNKLLQIFQKQDFVIREYEKKAQLLIKEIKQIQSEYAVLEIQPCKMKQNDQTKNDKTERIQKVRSMWTHIIEVLTSLKKEKEVVDSVFGELEDRDDQCILDGTNVVFSVPQLLAHRVESSIHQLCTGNVYEAENLNFLTVIQLLNEALRTLRDERCQPELEQLCVIENGITRCNTVLQNLKAKRLEIEQRCVTMSGSTSGKQEDWEVKWKSFLGLCPLNLIVDQDPELGLLCPLPAHSFNLAEEEDEDSTFCQYLVSVSDVCDSIREVHYEKGDGALKTMMDKSTLPPRRYDVNAPRISSVPMEFSKTSENRDVLIEKNSHIETCKGEKPMSPKVLKNGKDESAISELWKRAGGIVIQTESPAKKEDPLKKARDELAEEVAKAVVSESPQSGEGKSMALEDLISSLAFNPFLTRRQIPRTPENL
ncbi:PREDICTED: HAUS augmin-like complex subunit 6, partial [Leptosomus discolor]|uniref:HAUS augmin-like complex subunit 6 n=1 Tax=Leptosomus discolor TaxID=188344 RepID=UPI000522CBE9